MNLRRRRELRPDFKGRFYREIGWKLNGSGTKLIQHRFYLGKDRHEAELRIRLLEKLWQVIECQNGTSKPCWNERTLDIAQAIARGDTSYAVPRSPNWDGGIDGLYAHQVRTLAKTFASVITILPEDTDGFENGRQEELDLASRIQTIADNTRARVGASIVGGDGPTLHQAFDAYAQWIEREYREPTDNGEVGRLTDWGRNQTRTVQRLKNHVPDANLTDHNYAAVEAALRHWRNRPSVKGAERPIAVKTARSHIKQLKHFYRWLNRSEEFEWSLPEHFDQINCRVKPTKQERARRHSPLQVATFSLDDLCLLNQYATPLERLLLLLGLNCGFGKAEIGSLLMKQVFVRTEHPFAHLIRFDFRGSDSFIMGPRPKTGVWGDFLLWPQTVQAVEWTMERRKRQTTVTKGDGAGKDITTTLDSLLLLTEDGHSFLKPTAQGNANQRIPNTWRSLVRRVQKDNPDFHYLSFKHLRKTAGDLMRWFGGRRVSADRAGGEIAKIFLCHGNAVESDELADIYTNRPFGRVFEVLREVEEYLQPMFDAVPPEPFPEKRKKGGPNITSGQIRRIRSLRKQGFKIKKIAELVGVTTQTVHRHLKK